MIKIMCTGKPRYISPDKVMIIEDRVLEQNTSTTSKGTVHIKFVDGTVLYADGRAEDLANHINQWMNA